MNTSRGRFWTWVAALAFVLAGTGVAGAAPLADSVADFPTADNTSSDPKQGINNWSYGYHNVTANGAYETGDFIPFPDNSGPGTSPTDFWTGSSWDWHAGNPPWTEVTQIGGHPNGENQAEVHWAMRRWESTADGAVNIEFDNRKTNVNCGNGTIARVLVNGVEQSALPVAFNDGTGRSWKVHVPDLKAGDFVDLALDSNGADGCDGSAFGMKIDSVAALPSMLVASSTADFPAGDNTSSDSKQGINNWSYGYHSVTNNGGDGYQAADFIPFPDNQGPGTSPTDFWTGSAWDWHAGNPPWTAIGGPQGVDFGHPNTGAGDSQWAVRRWESDVEGDLAVETFFAKQNTTGPDGIIGRLFHNGVEVYTTGVIAPGDGIGLTDVTMIPGVQPGDFIDLVLDYNGNDGSDGSFFSAEIYRLGQPGDIIPEPATMALLGLAACGLGRYVRRRRKA